MTELSTETYILYNKTIIRGRNVLVQHIRGETSWSETSGSETLRSKKSRDETSWVRNVQVQKSGCETSWSKISGGKTSRSKICLLMFTYVDTERRPEASLFSSMFFSDARLLTITSCFQVLMLMCPGCIPNWGYISLDG